MHFFKNVIVYVDKVNTLIKSLKVISECGVTANIPGLGPGDSGFESRHSDREEKQQESSCCFSLSPIPCEYFRVT